MPKKKTTLSDEKRTYLNNDAKLLKLHLFSKFYNNTDNLLKVINIVKHNTVHSLRVLEWFCNNYSKKNNIIIKVSPTREINVYLEYKANIDSYTKEKFDPFNRDNKGYGKIDIPIPDAPSLKKFETTVAQLNFFRWIIKNKVLDYIEKNMQKIKDDMNNVALKAKQNKEQSKGKDPIKPKKRTALSVSATRTAVKNPSNNTMVKF